ncbi:hypothetical protein cand_011700 [Cryptosporidium andersoni]|uniref:Uncharacterized protein n=1 Tax=Cryptosporidium andersoni TaxID=117008 RepID=A0A1J4MEH1_9CRYT|nr:hypothetical protein cand_011700 [Cryptosporidium andersoni]
MVSIAQKRFYYWFTTFQISILSSHLNYLQRTKLHQEFLDYAYHNIGIRVIATDFDLTMMTRHSGGYINPLSASGSVFLLSLSQDFNILASVAQKMNIPISVVTFSDKKLIPLEFKDVCISGSDLISLSLKKSKASFKIDSTFCYYPKLWQKPQDYLQIGLINPMPSGKSFHLKKVCETYNIKPNQIIFIDDDVRNCRIALKEGYIAMSIKGNSGYSIDSIDISFYETMLD